MKFNQEETYDLLNLKASSCADCRQAVKKNATDNS